jgi:catechol 2,3-dioxygenase-like lactoylglutathione lyase family enzyme
MSTISAAPRLSMRSEACAAIAIKGRTEWPRGGRSIYFRDPDGHLLELAALGLWRND